MSSISTRKFCSRINRAVPFICVVITASILCPAQLLAHGNNVTHPGLTNAGITLADILEISDRGFFDVGTDAQCTFIDEGSVKEDRLYSASSSWNPDIWGESTCGVGVASWINHSYNPITGDGWWDLGGIDTLTYAVPIWEQAHWDYSYGDQNDAYFRLGRVCHLLEDMTSPAHVHGDVHWPEPEDFEIWGSAHFDEYDFSAMAVAAEIPMGTVDLPDGRTVDGDSIEGFMHTLAEYTYDLSAFEAHLIAQDVDQPDSELARMFPSLHYYDGGILGDNYWEIDDIGGFEQIASDEWWACASDHNDYTDPCGIRHIEGNFYIENSGGDSGTLTPAVLEKTGIYEANPNTETLLQIYGDVLFPKTVSYVAGLLYTFTDTIVEPPEPTYVSGTISQSTTWDLAHSPYVVTGDVTVASGITLTIDAGVVVKFEAVDNPTSGNGVHSYNPTSGNGVHSYRNDLIVNGTLNLLSTAGQKVVFTSSRDDSYGGDSNGDGAGTVSVAGNWGAIKYNNSGNVLHDAIIRYGGLGDVYRYLSGSQYLYSYRDTQMVWVNNCSPTISNCTFEHAYERALYYCADQAYNSSPQINGNTFSNCPYGIYYVGLDGTAVATPTITDNVISEGSNWGIRVSNIPAGGLISGNTLTNQSNGILLSNASPTVSNNSIINCSGYPVQQSETSQPSYSGNTILGNQNQTIAVSGTLSSDTTWSDIQGLGLPYCVTGDVTVASGITLTIDAGVVVKFEAVLASLS